MAAKTRTISTLIESQLPAFISNEYQQFSKFVEKYYEQLELRGQPLDIINNITKYRDINFYENSLLEQNTTLSSSILNNVTTITVEDTSSFPEKNGYIRIGDEICFYKEKTDTQFLEVSRGVSGNITLGDLYSESEFVTTQASNHYQGDVVHNVSNLFLYALVKNFENEYLGAFPEKYLKGEVDKRTLIKNISKFYKSKGTSRSIKFVFNSIVSKDPTERVEVYNPKDFTLKASTSDWISTYSLKVKIISGDVQKLIGNTIIQSLDDYDKSITYASAIVDNVVYSGKFDEDDIYELILQPSSVNGLFKVFSTTSLKSNISSTDTVGDRVTVYSTMGWGKQGKILVGTEVITFTDKNVNQFTITDRSNPQNHVSGKKVYNYSTLRGIHDSGVVDLISVGLVYNLLPKDGNPYSESGDFIQISDSGFETRDPIIFDSENGQVRWLINDAATKASSTYPVINQQVKSLVSDVSAVYQDDQYYYICSSSYPSYSDILNNTVTNQLSDQKILRLIRKQPTTTTEVYSTSTRDVGIFVDGSPAFSYKDEEFVKYGKILDVNIESKGKSYRASPTVLINNQPNKARSVLSGETVNSIIVDTDEIFETTPEITITSGRGAKLSAVVTNGRISSIVVVDPGEYYSYPPIIKISDDLGKGNFAEYEAVLTPDGKIDSCKRITGGRFYTRETTRVTVESVGFGAQATANVRKWIKNRYSKLSTKLDTNNSYSFVNYNPTRNYGYGVVANPVKLRYRLGDSINASFQQTNTITHSPILGYAYDGNPIYGPYGYSDPTNSESSITRLSSGYLLKGSRIDGPSTSEYPLGSLIDDYEWVPSINSGKTELDQNNGRFCVTPDYPNGIYAYFVTINSSNTPVFPYILGENFYSLPVDSNYNSNISQDDLPLNCKRLRTDSTEYNGKNVYALIQDVKSGNILSASVDYSADNFSVNNSVIIDDSLTDGFGARAIVSSVKGKEILSIESKQTKASKITVKQNAYLFEGDTITQKNSNDDVIASGILIGDSFNNNTFVLRDCEGEFNYTDKLFSETRVINVILDKNSTFTKGSILTLTDGKDTENSDIAIGEVLEGTNKQNSLKIKVSSESDFIIDSDYFIKSSNLSDTTRSIILNISSLSENLEVFDIDENIAIVSTSEPHNLAVDDRITVDVIPNDLDTETTYYVRKRLYQTAVLKNVSHKSVIKDTGVGRINFLNTGLDYLAGVYENVELIFRDSTLARNNIGLPGNSYNAKATVVIASYQGSGYGGIQSITITSKGSNYRKGDILTIQDSDLSRALSSSNNQRILLEVDHVGLASGNTYLQLSNVNNLSENDYLSIGNEIVQIVDVNVDGKYVQITRGEKGTSAVDHYNNKEVLLYQGNYRFDSNYRPYGDGQNNPYVINYDEDSKQIFVSYEYGTQNPTKLLLSSSFYDSSVPAKLVTIQSVSDPQFKLEFSQDNINLITNPTIKIQKYYKYKFDTSHYSMLGTFLDFSASANHNIFTEEKYTNNIPPGNAGSYLAIKFGFGPNISSNSFQNKQSVNYNNYFYFIKASNNVNTEDSYLNIIEDPLSGEKKIIYSTNDRFVYSLKDIPEYDGSGSMTYTTVSPNAIGEIDRIDIINTGNSYKKIPSVVGVVPTSSKECQVEVVYDSIGKKIVGFEIINQGQSYSKPKIAIINGDGTGGKFEFVTLNGKIKQIKVIDGGINYSYKPLVKVIESDVKIYLNSNNIGIPQNVKIIQNGSLFNSDNTTLPIFKSNTTFLLKDFIDTAFKQGEEIYQPSSGARARVSKNGFRPGTNLLKVDRIRGIFVNNSDIIGLSGKNTATLVAQISTEFSPDIKSYYDNLGYYSSDRGKLSTNSQKLTDSYFYQDYSYVIKSKTPIDIWRELIKETTHPAGFQLFGEVLIESEGSSTMPSEQKIIETYSCISLPPISLSVVSTKKQVTTTALSLNNLNIERGVGSISVDTFDSSEIFAREIGLTSAFNGDFNSDTSKPDGDLVFTMYDKKNNLPIVVNNPYQLVVTLDGIVQEPGEAFTVSGNQISFSSAPLGDRIVEGQNVEAQKFYGRLIRFKDASLNNQYFKKIKDISPLFDGKTTIFDLRYLNNSIVKTDPLENLLVFLNGVLQKSKIDQNTPYGNSYYILRSEDENETDKIVFSEPPLNPVESLDNPSKCFIHSIGSYERLTIDPEIIQYRKEGPYLIVDEVSKKVRKIDDPLYALVFIDGVLQEQNKSYKIVGPNITFASPLKKYITESGQEIYQNVSIILCYGRDIAKTLTFYDFNPDTFFNNIKLTLSGTSVSENFDVLTEQYSNHAPEFYLQKVLVYQNDILIGELKRVNKVSSNELELTILSPINLQDLSNDDLTFEVNTFNTYDLQGTYTISQEYYLNEDGERVLTRGKSEPIWLYGSSLGDDIETYRKNRASKSLASGDLIKIDGEKSYRQIISIPDIVKPKNYNVGGIVTNDLYSRISSTNYNDITRGEGLSITADIDNDGSITNLNWNKKDLELYFENNVLLQPTAYQYYTTPIIEFIPADENGGGAIAEIISYGGQILDIVLIDGGFGYTEPPQVVIARGYDRIKSNYRKIDSTTNFTISPKLDSTRVIISTSVNMLFAGQQQGIISIVSFGSSFGEKTTERQITEIITPPAKESKVSYASIGITNVVLTDIVEKSSVSISPSISPNISTQLRTFVNVSSISVTKQLTTGIISGLFDYPSTEEYTYGLANAGYNIGTFDANCLLGTGSSTVSGFTIEEFDLWFPNVTIEEFQERKLSHYFVGGEIFNVVPPSVQEFGTYIDAPLSESNTVVYVNSTTGFKSSGLLLIDKEIIRYTDKENDRFLGLTRGYLNSPISSHDFGIYIRSIEIADLPLDYILDPAPG
jgi:hypothetical protein